jgi:hypothetical protein
MLTYADVCYRYGVSTLVDEILAASYDNRGGPVGELRGRAPSVPLVNRPFWQTSEVGSP